MPPEQCATHAEQIRQLDIEAAETRAHLGHITNTLDRLDAKLDRLDAKVDAKVDSLASKVDELSGRVGAAATAAATAATEEKSSKSKTDWKALAVVSILSAFIAWGPKALSALAVILLGKSQ